MLPSLVVPPLRVQSDATFCAEFCAPDVLFKWGPFLFTVDTIFLAFFFLLLGWAIYAAVQSAIWHDARGTYRRNLSKPGQSEAVQSEQVSDRPGSEL